MPVTRIYHIAPLQADSTVTLNQRAAHHLLNVLRAGNNDPIILFNGDDCEYQATLNINGKTVTATIHTVKNAVRESPVHITLVQGVSRGDRMDWAIQKAVELGVSRICPVYSQRSMKAPDDKRAEKKQQHWQGILISACEQSGRCRLPVLETAQTLTGHLTESKQIPAKYVLDPNASRSLPDALTAADELEILIGPEGGLTEKEITTATGACYQPVSLGPRILRTETAGIAALAIIQSRLGDLK